MTPTYPIRFTRALVLATILAAFAVPTVALASSSSGKAAPDSFERYVAAHPFGYGVLDVSKAPDVFERYVAAHPFGYGVLDVSNAPDVFERYAATHEPTVLFDGRSPDTLEAADTVQLQVTDGRSPDTRDAAGTAQLQIVDGRSQDTLDAAQAVQPIELVNSGGFDWSDAGIGAATGAALILLMGASMLLLLRIHRRQRVQAT